MPLRVIITAAKTVSRASAEVSLSVGDHQRDDQRHLDHGDRHGEHQRAERLADPVRDHLGVVHRGQHRADQDDADHREHDRLDGTSGVAPPGGGEQDQRHDRDDDGPAEPAGRHRAHGLDPRDVDVRVPVESRSSPSSAAVESVLREAVVR